MNALEQATESLCAVRDEINAILRTGPVITREEAFRVGNLMRLTGKAVLDRAEDLPASRPDHGKEEFTLSA